MAAFMSRARWPANKAVALFPAAVGTYVRVMGASDILTLKPAGLYCAAGDFFIDPLRAVPRALITHAHSDHARPGHGQVLATAETLAVMSIRYGENFAGATQTVRYGEALKIGGIDVSFYPRWPCARLGANPARAGRHEDRRLRRLQARAPTPHAPPSNRSSATPSSARRRSVCRCSAMPMPPARSTSCSPRKTVSRAHASRRRLSARQGAAHHRAAAAGRLRPADLHPRRARKDHRLLPVAGVTSAMCASPRPRARCRAKSSSARQAP